MELATPYEQSFDATLGVELTEHDDQRVSAQRGAARFARLNREAWLPTIRLA
jgi:hypothetical protein